MQILGILVRVFRDFGRDLGRDFRYFGADFRDLGFLGVFHSLFQLLSEGGLRVGPGEGVLGRAGGAGGAGGAPGAAGLARLARLAAAAAAAAPAAPTATRAPRTAPGEGNGRDGVKLVWNGSKGGPNWCEMGANQCELGPNWSEMGLNWSELGPKCLNWSQMGVNWLPSGS